MPETLITHAARNGAEWCHAATSVCGNLGEFTEHYWFNRYPTPNYITNLITLSPDSDAPLSRLEALIKQVPQQQWSVRDCFFSLDLSALGFHVSLEGMRLHVPHNITITGADNNIRFSPVDNAAQLSAWGRAWAGGGECPEWCQPALLHNPDITIFTGMLNDRIVCGCATTRAAGMIGISNLFVLSSPQIIACLQAVQDYFPEQTLIGYESIDAVAYYQSFGLKAPGRMRIWVRDAA